MHKFPVGVMLNSFRTGCADALEKAAEIGVQGVQVHVADGELGYRTVTDAALRKFLESALDKGLVISALCGDIGNFCDASKNPEMVENSKRILNLARRMGTRVVTSHIGVVPDDPKHERYKIMQEACFEICRRAEELGAYFAVETGPETAVTLKRFLDSLNSRGAAVNLDPANLVMVMGEDPAAAVHTLKDYIVHTHAKDGRRLFAKDPEVVYGLKEEETPTGHSYKEVPLGEGDVDFGKYLRALDEIGYRGFLTIEREVGENPARDIALAVDFLKKQVG